MGSPSTVGPRLVESAPAAVGVSPQLAIHMRWDPWWRRWVSEWRPQLGAGGPSSKPACTP